MGIEDHMKDFASNPADTIREIMKVRKLGVFDFANLMDWTISDSQLFFKGEIRIDEETARKLSKHFGSSLPYWMSRDVDYCRVMAGKSKLVKVTRLKNQQSMGK